MYTSHGGRLSVKPRKNVAAATPTAAINPNCCRTALSEGLLKNRQATVITAAMLKPPKIEIKNAQIAPARVFDQVGNVSTYVISPPEVLTIWQSTSKKAAGQAASKGFAFF